MVIFHFNLTLFGKALLPFPLMVLPNQNAKIWEITGKLIIMKYENINYSFCNPSEKYVKTAKLCLTRMSKYGCQNDVIFLISRNSWHVKLNFRDGITQVNLSPFLTSFFLEVVFAKGVNYFTLLSPNSLMFMFSCNLQA